MKKILLAITSLIAVTFFSCTEKNTIGTDLPNNDKLEVFDTSVSVFAYTIKDHPILSTANTYNLLGSYTDPIFGLSVAGFSTQLVLPSSSTSFGPNPTLDSMILGLAYSGFYGDTSVTQTVKVYELDEELKADSSNKVFLTKSTALGQLTFKPNTKDSVFAEGKKRAAQLRIKLDFTQANELFNKIKSASNTEALLSDFKGLKVIAQENTGSGAILYFNLLSDQSKLNIYYKNDTTALNSALVISSSSIRVNYFNEINNTALYHTVPPAKSDSLLYLQAMARAKVFIKLPNIEGITGKCAIHKAEIAFPVNQSFITGRYTPPSQLFLLGRDSLNQNYILDDQLKGLQYFGGSYTDGKYTFNIAQHVQKILNGTIKDQGLHLIPGGTAVSADRVVLDNQVSNKITLKLTYTKLP